MNLIQLDELLTIGEAAALLKVSEHCIRAWFTRGPCLPRVKAGRRTLVRRSDLSKLLVVTRAGSNGDEAA